MTAPFRFGLALASGVDDDPVQQAVDAEAAGFDVVVATDHIGPGYAPMQLLSAVAQATSRIRLGTLVLNADVRNPTQVAWEAVTLDWLSDGRFELGLGAGHTPHEYDALGLVLRPARERKLRLMEVVEVVRRLLDGETVDHRGDHLSLAGAHVGRSVQPRLPILVGGNGATLLGHAGAHADIVGLQGLGRTLADGHRHSVRWTIDHLDGQLDQIRAGAGARHDDVELNALVQVVDITDDRERSLAELARRIDGLDPAQAGELPYLLIGTVDEIAEQLLRARERWGISYYVVRDLPAFAPVVQRVRERSR
jgi:probable F420-dependent oxidoreductase